MARSPRTRNNLLPIGRSGGPGPRFRRLEALSAAGSAVNEPALKGSHGAGWSITAAENAPVTATWGRRVFGHCQSSRHCGPVGGIDDNTVGSDHGVREAAVSTETRSGDGGYSLSQHTRLATCSRTTYAVDKGRENETVRRQERIGNVDLLAGIDFGSLSQGRPTLVDMAPAAVIGEDQLTALPVIASEVGYLSLNTARRRHTAQDRDGRELTQLNAVNRTDSLGPCVSWGGAPSTNLAPIGRIGPSLALFTEALDSCCCQLPRPIAEIGRKREKAPRHHDRASAALPRETTRSPPALLYSIPSLPIKSHSRASTSVERLTCDGRLT
ncbi:hypothetical protein CPLU01_08075 [Colletotrichum plurivorum]|uniref:Uncharacterized protein n=1 Tax=Colletotrichum plurivorum TaxID=2175906 RepID=A0A8H6KDN8_9PEZI|nr:hypothetical protein CPLU01_08075 [Colletotrichum plurivorum]